MAVGFIKKGASAAAEKGTKMAKEIAVDMKNGLTAAIHPPERPAAPAASVAVALPNDVIFTAMSHEPGRNAIVTLYRDRIERVKQRSRMSMGSTHQDAEMTPIRVVTGVETRKHSPMFSDVIVSAAGTAMVFRLDQADAKRFREEMHKLILAHGEPPAAAVVAAPAPDITDQIKKLAELREAGILSVEEFEAKKTELLARL